MELMNACMHANEYIHTTRYLECLDTLARHTTPNGECANNEFKTSRCGIDPSSNTSINPERCVPSFPKKEKGKKKKKHIGIESGHTSTRSYLAWTLQDV